VAGGEKLVTLTQKTKEGRIVKNDLHETGKPGFKRGGGHAKG